MTKRFDIFLSHNSKDKPAVRELAEMLHDRGLKVWLDEWELVPGKPWQEALEEVIEITGSAAVLVGKDGLGPWQDAEMRGCLSEFLDRKMPVIPVLLPGVPEVPRLPFFLKRFTWVDLRGGLTEEGLDRLQWGATGKRPGRSELPSIPTAAPEPKVVANKEQLAAAEPRKFFEAPSDPALATKDPQEVTRADLEALEREFRGRQLALTAFTIGSQHSDPLTMEQSEENKDYILEAIFLSQQAYELLKELPGQAKYLPLNNLVYYSCLLPLGSKQDLLLEQGRELREIALKHRPYSSEYLLTYARSVAVYGTDLGEIRQALASIEELLHMDLARRQMKEATFIAASLAAKLAKP